MDELSAIYSNVSRESLTYNGKEYDHLRDVVNAQVEDLEKQLDLQNKRPPPAELMYAIEDLDREYAKRQWQEEERELLNSGVSELSDSLSDWGISFEPVKVPLMITDMSITNKAATFLFSQVLISSFNCPMIVAYCMKARKIC